MGQIKVLITGAAGFTGSYLNKFLSEETDHKIFLVDSKPLDSYPASLTCDLAEPDKVKDLVAKIQPDQIYHLAGSFANHFEVDFKSNVLTTKTLFESLLDLNIKARILLVGSAAEYGLVNPKDNPVAETHSLSPISHYGLTKIFQKYCMDYFFNVHRMDIVLARPFNLLGKEISPKLFIGRVYEQLKLYKEGKLSKITVGNLEAKRDYIDVHEAVKQYYLIMEKGIAGQSYNIGSGQPIKIRDLLQKLLEDEGLDMKIIEQKERDLSGKLDAREIYADISKLKNLERQT